MNVQKQQIGMGITLATQQRLLLPLTTIPQKQCKDPHSPTLPTQMLRSHWMETEASALAAQLSFLVSLIQAALFHCGAGASEVKRWFKRISPSQKAITHDILTLHNDILFYSRVTR